jgi:methylated-DNA-protein-cysteine methyltransferase related protein
MKERSMLSEHIIMLIKSIPFGRVTTYGSLAFMAGNKGASLHVVRILNSCSIKDDLPWYRVVNSKGTISLTGEGYDEQRRLLEEEGIVFDDKGRIDFSRYLWRPGL